MTYDVTIITVRPGTHPDALARLRPQLVGREAAGEFLACWYSELGAINQILLIHAGGGEGAVARRGAIVTSKDPFGVSEFMTGLTMDTYVSFPFMPRITSGRCGPIYEVRSYVLRPDGLATTIELWRKAVPGRLTVSTLLAAMYSVTGPLLRFMHIWPYASLDERQRLRTKAVADGVWPPPGGPDQLVAQQADIFLPADFSPLN
jgi:NIPSNAP protein